MFKYFLIFLMFTGLVLGKDEQRADIGASAYIHIMDSNMDYLARIDSGARITSLNAVNIKLECEKPLIYMKPLKKIKGLPFKTKKKNEEYKRNIGYMISFDTVNEKGQWKHMRALVVDVARVRNAQGIEYRYVIRLGLRYKNITKYMEVNLRNRSHMSYKLLIGRNWLNNDFNIKTDLRHKTSK